MQRSLLPRERPAIAGLEIGTVYESAAQVDVGGDVYDFLELPDGRLAIVLGDVTGHGIDATADMAMAKFVFRSLAREHPEPPDFLAHANEVVVGEIAVGKFITMAYLTRRPGAGEVLCASAGHPEPRLVRARRPRRRRSSCGGLALGIDEGQTYEQVRRRAAAGRRGRALHRRRGRGAARTASCTARAARRRCSPRTRRGLRRRSPMRCSRTAATSRAASSRTTARSSSIRLGALTSRRVNLRRERAAARS